MISSPRWKRAIPKWKKPTLVERFKALMKIRSAARGVSDRFRATPGGDEFIYTGGMNEVELLRDTLDEYDGLYYRLAKEKRSE